MQRTWTVQVLRLLDDLNHPGTSEPFCLSILQFLVSFLYTAVTCKCCVVWTISKRYLTVHCVANPSIFIPSLLTALIYGGYYFDEEACKLKLDRLGLFTPFTFTQTTKTIAWFDSLFFKEFIKLYPTPIAVNNAIMCINQVIINRYAPCN